MPRFKEVRTKRGLLAREVAQSAGIDEGLYSKIENHRALPIPADLSKILAVLNCAAEDVYDPAEVALLPSAGVTKGGARETDRKGEYKLTVRLSGESRTALTKKHLQKCGYKSVSDFVAACVRQLDAEKEKPRQTSGGGQRGGTEGRHTTDFPDSKAIIPQKNQIVKEATK